MANQDLLGWLEVMDPLGVLEHLANQVTKDQMVRLDLLVHPDRLEHRVSLDYLVGMDFQDNQEDLVLLVILANLVYQEGQDWLESREIWAEQALRDPKDNQEMLESGSKECPEMTVMEGFLA